MEEKELESKMLYLFYIIGSPEETEKLEKTLKDVFKTEEGEKLLVNLYSSKLCFELCVDENLGDPDGALKGRKIVLKTRDKTQLELVHTLAHELCHALQLNEQKKKVFTKNEEEYDLCSEIEARVLSAKISLEKHPIDDKENRDVDVVAYDCLKRYKSDELKNAGMTDEKEINRLVTQFVHTEFIKSIWSGEINQILNEKDPKIAERFKGRNDFWHDNYRVQALMNGMIKEKSFSLTKEDTREEELEKMAKRLGVDLKTFGNPLQTFSQETHKISNNEVETISKNRAGAVISTELSTYDDKGQIQEKSIKDKDGKEIEKELHLPQGIMWIEYDKNHKAMGIVQCNLDGNLEGMQFCPPICKDYYINGRGVSKKEYFQQYSDEGLLKKREPVPSENPPQKSSDKDVSPQNKALSLQKFSLGILRFLRKSSLDSRRILKEQLRKGRNK